MAASRRASLVNAICLISISILNLLVHCQASCPTPCTCDEVQISVFCASSSLERVPPGIPQSVQHLDLHGNRIENLGNSLQSLTNLRTLDLSDNNLKDLPNDVFEGLVNIVHLRLETNYLNSSLWGALKPLNSLSELSLGNNRIEVIQPYFLENMALLKILDLHGNLISELPSDFPQQLPNLQTFNLSGNSLANLTTTNTSEPLPFLQILDLSTNELTYVDCDAFSYYPSLQKLYLSENNLTLVNPTWFQNLTNLNILTLARNPIEEIQAMAFSSLRQMYSLDLSFMPNLTHIHYEAFNGLENLKQLSITNNPKLDYLHAAIFSQLNSLVTLDLSYNSLNTVYMDTFLNLTSIETINLEGNSWLCDCDLRWLYEWLLSNDSASNIFSASDFLCSFPVSIQGLQLTEIPFSNYSCSEVTILNYTDQVLFKLGSEAILNCPVEGDPKPAITWITPRGLVIQYHPAFIDAGSVYDPSHHLYHNSHEWHNSEDYYRHKQHHEKGRIHVLKNGSLYIDYVLRKDTGPYTCFAQNSHGNATAVTNLWLNYLILRDTTVISIIIGFVSAGLFFLLGLIVGVLRYIAFKCSKEQRQKRKSIRQILEGLEAYKTAQFDKFSAYKTAKFDQLSAFKSAKVDKLKNYKKVTATTLVHYLHRMREHYTHQIAQVRGNCTTKAERLRENYNTHMSKFKDYRSHQIDKIRENYQGQVMKIRDYGASQMEKLRDQYKLQQQHVLKLMEILDIGNCMTVIEAECMRTESMLFDPDLNLDLDAHPVHIPYHRRSSQELSDSEYITAGSDGSSFKSHLDINPSKISKSTSPQKDEQQNEQPQTSPETVVSQSHKKHKKAQRKHRYSKKTSRHPATQDSTSDLDEYSSVSEVRQGKSRDQKKSERQKAARNRAASRSKQLQDTDESSMEALNTVCMVTEIIPPGQLHLDRAYAGSSNVIDKLSEETDKVTELPHHGKHEPSPGAESQGTGTTEPSSTDYYESACQSRDQTPDIVSSPSATTPSFTSASQPSTPSTPTLTLDDTHVVLEMEPDQYSLSAGHVSHESSV